MEILWIRFIRNRIVHCKMRYLLLSVLVVCAIGTISMVPVALAYSGLGDADGTTLEEHLELAEGKVQDAAPYNLSYSGGSGVDNTLFGYGYMWWLIWIFLIVVPTALVILVVIAIKKMRRKK